MTEQPDSHPKKDWLQLQRDQETGIESVHAHFTGHAYDAHDHDEVLVGLTLQGLQRFYCRRVLHTGYAARWLLSSRPYAAQLTSRLAGVIMLCLSIGLLVH